MDKSYIISFNELKSESEHLISDYLECLKNVCKSFKKIL